MEIKKEYACAIFGHRHVEWNERVERRTKRLFRFLIKKKKVSIFLFGTNSEFYHYCYKILESMRSEFFQIRIVGMPCVSESMCLRGEAEGVKKMLKKFAKIETDILEFDEIYNKNERFVGKNAYVVRNYRMVDLSEYLVFYFDRMSSGGTCLAFEYGIKKRRAIFNVK